MSGAPTTIGRYHVERILGEGGMGVLYLARDPVLERHVALKLLRVDGENLRRRLMREAQSAARLQHPNIVTVYDVGDHDGQLYIAMEYIDGDTLGALIRDDVPFSPIRKLDIIDEVAEGLGFAHQRGIIHRDIKPANLMMSRSGLVKVLDFGIARVSHRESGEIDAPTLIGTPAYMAPEQLEGADVDARSDIYAVGLVMYELFSGRRAFVGATTADILQQVLESQPTPIEHLVSGIDPALAKVIARAMARKPEDRYQDLQEMRKDLARVRRRAIQASSDDATIVVTMPITGAVPKAAVPHHMAPPDTVDAVAAPPPTAPQFIPPPLPVQPSSAPITAAPPPSAVAPVDEGPVPMPLPPSAADGIANVPGAGPATVGASAAIATTSSPAEETRAAANEPVPAASPDGAVAISPRAAVPSAPPPVAAPGVVQSSAALGAPVPSPRRGVPAALIVAGLVGMLGVCFLVAFLAARSFGLFSGAPLTGLFSRNTEPKTDAPSPAPPTEVAEAQPAALEEAPASASPPPDDVPTEVPMQPSTTTAMPVAPPTTTVPAPSTAPVVPAPRPAQPATRTRPPATAERQPAAPDRPARETRPTPPLPGPSQPAVEVPPVAAEPPPRPIERREPEPPPVIAPEGEALALVRAYVAARNTAHASGIRRVWPGVDDNHLRRVTSAFSAPLTLSECSVEARDGAHATATCRLTQPGTTGPFASGQGVTIRRTFVFDLLRDGRAWVIAGLRE